jgi:biotin carboxylase
VDVIVFIGTNKSGSSRDAIAVAKELGLYTILLTDKKSFMKQRQEFVDVDELTYIDITNVDRIREYIKTIEDESKKIICIISFLESHVYTAAALSDEYGLGGFTTEAILDMEDKIKTRQLLNGLPVNPYYDVYKNEEELASCIERNSRKLPLIVKSPTSTGSKDVFRVETNKELKKKMITLQRKYPESAILLEEFLDGHQFLIEVLVKDNIPYIVAVIKQEIMEGDHFIVTGYSILPKYDMDPQIIEVVNKITDIFAIQKGMFHLEMRLVNGTWKIIEVNPRISGGAMNRMIYYYCGINLLRESIKLYLGQEIDLMKKFERFVYAQYLTIYTNGRLNKVTGKHHAGNIVGVEEVYIKPRKGMFLRRPTSMGHRYGYVIASGQTEKEAKETAILAAKKIKFYILPV